MEAICAATRMVGATDQHPILLGHRCDKPTPRISDKMSRENFARRLRKRAHAATPT